MSLRAVVLALAAVVSLASCAPKITLIDQKTGEMGIGSAENTTLGSSGPITVKFSGETYTGNWVAVADSGSTSFGSFNAYGTTTAFGAQPASASTNIVGTSNIFTSSTTGNGSAFLMSEKGNKLRCQVRYDSMTMTGIGICQRQDGALFDLQMTAS
ncbi:hypothetical protein [Shimia sp.]|uniref:hypothetical protein n=1 Tax=Shimia sp. TaxID=1954381 RepID=UPI003B8D4BA3